MENYQELAAAAARRIKNPAAFKVGHDVVYYGVKIYSDMPELSAPVAAAINYAWRFNVLKMTVGTVQICRIDWRADGQY